MGTVARTRRSRTRTAGTAAAGVVEQLERRLLLNGGDFDTTFGYGSGYVKASYSNFQNDFLDVGRQVDGRIIAVGQTQNSMGHRDAIFANFSEKGKFNTNFGAGGASKINFGASLDDIATSVVIQPDNLILGVGITGDSTGQDIWLARYKADGKTDHSFNGVGYRRIDWGGFDYASRVIYDTKIDKILVVGSTANPASGGGLVIGRYNLDGSNDTSFGTNGIVKTNPGAFKVDAGTDIYRQSDGKYLAVGGRLSFNGSGFTGSQAYAWRVNNNGSTDTSFGTMGWQITSFGRSWEFYNRVSQGLNGQIYTAGTSANGFYEFGTTLPFSLSAPAATQSQWIFSRYNLGNGSLDSGWGIGGKQTISFGGTEKAGLGYGTVQSDGSFVCGGGTTITGQNSRIATARLNPMGQLDSTWGTGGKRIYGLTGLAVGLYSLRMFKGGWIYGVGHAKMSGSMGSMYLGRFQNTGSFAPF
jgi:uncharacterized delta-60 repeat protein